MKLKKLCRAAEIDCPQQFGETEITSVAMDSREITSGGLFLCIRGLHTDGHTYIDDAIRSGAVCIVTEAGYEPLKKEGVILLSHPNPRRAAAMMYHAWYGYPAKRLKMIGVTGTNGKTSVTHMLRAILEASFCRCGIIGTVGCESAGRRLLEKSTDPLANMTTPDPPVLYRMLAEMVADGVEYVLMEVTSHALALCKLDPIGFDVAVFTNLTPEHLDFHGTMEAYANAKAKLFQRSRCCVINLDSPYAAHMIASAAGRVVTCGIKRQGDYNAEPIEDGEKNGVIYNLRSGSSAVRLFCPIEGSFSVMNSMQAVIVARELGLGMTAIKDALASVLGIRGRMERVRLGFDADFTVLIDYAHTPDALENLLRTCTPLKRGEGRTVLLFGCGGDRDRSKRAEMGRLASQYADYVIVTSDNSRGEDPNDIIREILVGIDPQKPHTVIVDRAEAIRQAILTARTGDVILLAGKGHEEYEIDRTGRKPFLEKEIVREAFAERQRRKKYNDGTETER